MNRTWPTSPGLIHWAFGFLIGIPFGRLPGHAGDAPETVPHCALLGADHTGERSQRESHTPISINYPTWLPIYKLLELEANRLALVA